MGMQTNQALPSEARRSTRKRTAAESSTAAGPSKSKPVLPEAPAPKRAKKAASEEKRLRKRASPTYIASRRTYSRQLTHPRPRFRPQPPQTFYEIYNRATSQRFFVLCRTRCGTPGGPEETVELTGSTGNIYNVHIARQPTCDCPHGQAGNQCKHWLYVMSRVLRARFDLVYQLALVESELREIFAHAPPPIDPDAAASSASDHPGSIRKSVEGDCPICFDKLDASAAAEKIVWCRAACGQNMHRQCFQMWSATKRQKVGAAAGSITCPLCRSVWQADDDNVRDIKNDGPLNEDGYVNVADQLGISTDRDYSSYSRWWGGHPQGYRRRR